MHRCKTRASLPLDAIRRPRDTPIWKLESSLKCRSRDVDSKVRAMLAVKAANKSHGTSH